MGGLGSALLVFRVVGGLDGFGAWGSGLRARALPGSLVVLLVASRIVPGWEQAVSLGFCLIWLVAVNWGYVLQALSLLSNWTVLGQRRHRCCSCTCG